MDGDRGCKVHLVCMACAAPGQVEIQYRDRTVQMTVPVGESIVVKLRDTVTTITRNNQGAFHVESHARAA